MDIKKFIRTIPNFPKPGIDFKDITPLLGDNVAFLSSVQSLSSKFDTNVVDLIVAPESRGFIFGVGVSVILNKGFVPVRKPGKLPFETYKQSYDLEYGKDTLEIHKDGIKKGQHVILVDDVLATGGTMKACIELVEKCGGVVVGCSFLIEIVDLNGRKNLEPYSIHSLIQY